MVDPIVNVVFPPLPPTAPDIAPNPPAPIEILYEVLGESPVAYSINPPPPPPQLLCCEATFPLLPPPPPPINVNLKVVLVFIVEGVDRLYLKLRKIGPRIQASLRYLRPRG